MAISDAVRQAVLAHAVRERWITAQEALYGQQLSSAKAVTVPGDDPTQIAQDLNGLLQATRAELLQEPEQPVTIESA